MFGESGIEDQYDEDESWEAKGFLEGMEEADSDKKKKTQFQDEFGNEETEFEDKFSDDF
ncbi:MAG: hypothetical protein GOV01_00100 [Candidatus Altiarchaeota archaeon]|nr:hypothetical protein [Candidatus Altiarchaeota archaeon]